MSLFMAMLRFTTLRTTHPRRDSTNWPAVYAEHFTPFNVAAISLWPGYVATERMTQLMETDPGVNHLKEKMGFESTELSGRVIRALYDDPNLLTLSGKTIITAEAAERYAIRDLDGYEPKSLRGVAFTRLTRGALRPFVT